MAPRNEFGELIRRAREKRGMTGVELAERIGRSHSMVVRWETGQTANAPEPDLFWEFGRALGLEPETMLEALGYLQPDADRPQDHPLISAIRPIIGEREFTDKEMRDLTDAVRIMVRMMDGG